MRFSDVREAIDTMRNACIMLERASSDESNRLRYISYARSNIRKVRYFLLFLEDEALEAMEAKECQNK